MNDNKTKRSKEEKNKRERQRRSGSQPTSSGPVSEEQPAPHSSFSWQPPSTCQCMSFLHPTKSLRILIPSISSLSQQRPIKIQQYQPRPIQPARSSSATQAEEFDKKNLNDQASTPRYYRFWRFGG